MTLAFVVLGLVVAMAIAMIAFGYGIGVEGSVPRAGRSRRLYRRNAQVVDCSRKEALQPTSGGHKH